MRRTRLSAASFGIALLLVLGLGMEGWAAGLAQAARELPAGSSAQTVRTSDGPRSFRVYRPAGLTGPAPLVLVLHGGFGTAQQAERAYGWNAQADRGRFLVAYPNGRDRSWNAGSCCGAGRVNDVAFLRRVVADVQRRAPVDSSRVFIAGMSNGAMMALRMGCQTGLFAGIAAVAGTQLAGCGTARPTSVLQIHGTADQRVPYRGGPGMARDITGRPRVNGPSAEAVNARWRAIDGCADPVTTSSGPVTRKAARCPGGRAVELITIHGGRHEWPGGRGAARTLDATSTIWKFFAAH